MTGESKSHGTEVILNPIWLYKSWISLVERTGIVIHTLCSVPRDQYDRNNDQN